ncbi:hypothetical protein C9J21_18510 [Photobacterium phosphoreum]|uniref:hypothetical protein n=1 Tax=Photobacterium phosphoreum TaxID=659 RepID=UPI000D172C3D|nr:hypothetical protein [Photobacterium phosphoreum]PSW30798.1 hypothetical protein C9J21_18510 [Photobacterium phosphoreum]
MIFPSLHKADVKNVRKQTFIKQHTEKEPYYYITERNGFYFLYTSSLPTTAIAESYYEHFVNESITYVLIHTIDNNKCFYMVVSNGDIVFTKESTFDALDDIYFDRSTTIYLIRHGDCDSEKLESLVNKIEYKNKWIEIDQIDLKKIPLIAKKSFPLKTTISTIFLSLGIIGGAAYFYHQDNPEPTPEMAVPVDPYLNYRTQVSSMVMGSSAIREGTTLAVITSQIPIGWKASPVIITNNHIQTEIIREDHGSMSVMRMWLKMHNQLLKYSHFNDIAAVSIYLPIGEDLSDYTDRIMPINTLSESLIDYLLMSGWVVNKSSSTLLTSTQTLTCSIPKITPSEFFELAKLINHSPIGLSELTINPLTNGAFSVSLTLLIIGDNA